jgi:hypothetical protein
MCRMSRHERLPKSLHDAQQADEGHWTTAPGNCTGNLPTGACSLKVTADSREAAIGRRKSGDHQRAVNQRGRYDHDRCPRRIPGDRADQAADQPQQQEPAKGARLNAKRDCRPAAAFVPRQGYQPTGESLLDPDPPINRPDQQTDRKRRKPRDPRHAPSLTGDRLPEQGAAEWIAGRESCDHHAHLPRTSRSYDELRMLSGLISGLGAVRLATLRS